MSYEILRVRRGQNQSLSTQCNTEPVPSNMKTIFKSKWWFKTAKVVCLKPQHREMKFAHCCIQLHADWIDIIRVNKVKTLKIGTLKYKWRFRSKVRSKRKPVPKIGANQWFNHSLIWAQNGPFFDALAAVDLMFSVSWSVRATFPDIQNRTVNCLTIKYLFAIHLVIRLGSHLLVGLFEVHFMLRS